MFSTRLQLGVPRGPYPERQDVRATTLEQAWAALTNPLLRQVRLRQVRLLQFVQTVAAAGQPLAHASLDDLAHLVRQVRQHLRQTGLDIAGVAQSFALVREVAERTLGMRHFDVQIMGGWILLNGMVAEMGTGEGKTLTATLPACTMALAGFPVHIITVNDYLAERDAASMGPVYAACGLSVGVITQGLDAPTRRAAYACDVTYCTNKELTFDYLKDRLTLGRQAGRLHLQLERLMPGPSRLQQLLLRGLVYGIVDEADSVLIDEARTPLIISGSAENTTEQHLYHTALSLASELTAERHFTLQGRERTVQLTAVGQDYLSHLAQPHGGLWTGQRRREELVRQALTALHLMQRDTHYLVRDHTVQIIDEFTGRVMPDRAWEHGLHQMVETKEGCPLTSRREPLVRLTYQRFFRRYLRLAGMTGTAREVRRELWSVYRLAVVRIPSNRPLQRRPVRDRLYATSADKWAAVVARVRQLHPQGRPLLIGTRSVGASEHLSHLLTLAHLPHQVLNARQDQEEASIIARAGAYGAITVATNMAGRGTDIHVSPEVVVLGGLHVIATERHEARRIDRQLFGRCGRQGDPGSYEAIMALEDELFTVYAQALWQRLGQWCARPGHSLARPIRLWLLWRAQRAAERVHGRMRRDLLRMDEQLETILAFSGQSE